MSSPEGRKEFQEFLEHPVPSPEEEKRRKLEKSRNDPSYKEKVDEAREKFRKTKKEGGG